MLRRIVLAGLLLFCAPAAAGYNTSFNLLPADLGVSGAALTGNPTFTIRTMGYAALTLYAQVTRASATAITVSCTAGPLASVQAPISVSTVANSGVISMAPAMWSYPISTSGTVRVIVSPVNDVFTTCTVGGNGAVAGDLVSVYARVAGTP